MASEKNTFVNIVRRLLKSLKQDIREGLLEIQPDPVFHTPDRAVLEFGNALMIDFTIG